MKVGLVIVVLLLCAAVFGWKKVAQKNNPVYLHDPEEIFTSPLLEIAAAIRNDDVETIKSLVRKTPGIDLDDYGREKMTLLFWAVGHQHDRSVKALLELGADPNRLVGAPHGEWSLVALASGGDNDATFRHLITHGGDVNGRVDGTPAIIKTVYARRFDRMRYLLDAGADIDVVDHQSKLSLTLFCAKLNLYEQVVYLLERGADHTFENNIGSSLPYQVQKRKGQLNPEIEKWRAKVEQILVERGVELPVVRKRAALR